MGTEYHQQVPIVYGLGNFLFDTGRNKPIGGRLGLIARLVFNKQGKFSLELLPVMADNNTGCIDLLDVELLQYFDNFYRTISDPLRCMKEIESLWNTFCASQAPHLAKESLKAILAMIPSSLLELIMHRDKSSMKESYYIKGANILRGLMVCENHQDVIGRILGLIRMHR